MSTGYTENIENGKITTGKDFLKLCAMAFGIAVETHFEPDSYYKEIYDKALEELDKAVKMTFDEAKTQMKLDYENRISEYKHIAEKWSAMNEKYTKVRKEVEAWNPPTEEHEGLKKFALKQIDMCMTTQEKIDKYLEKSKEIFDGSDKAVQKYKSKIIAACQEQVANSYESWLEEQKRAMSKNEWISEFLESLENIGQDIQKDNNKYVKVDRGEKTILMPLEDYLDARAYLCGFDSYEDMKKSGLLLEVPDIVNASGEPYKKDQDNKEYELE